MNIIFNEYSLAEELLKNGFRNFMSGRDLGILAKYFKYKNLDEKEIYNKLEDFCIKFFPEYNPVIDDIKILSAISKSKKQELSIPYEMYITEKELNIIRSVNNYKYELCLFVMLVVARYNKIKHNSSEYYLNDNVATFLKMVDLYMNKNEKEKMRQFFNNENLVVPTLPPTIYNKKENYKLLFANEQSDKVIKFTDYSNLKKYYKFICDECGIEMTKKTEKRNLCDDCYNKKRKNIINENAKKYYKDKFYTDN